MLTIYKASAGSGKTFTLAKDYIKMLLGIKNKITREYSLNYDPDRKRLRTNNPHASILAITFTRKATEEMKTRIISELALLARLPQKGADDSPYAAMLTAELHCSREHLAQASELALKQMLYDYDDFNVSTIDSFFQRVLHTFARELDLQGDYMVELNSTNAMKMAVGAMLDKFNFGGEPDKKLESWLYTFMNQQLRRGKQSNIFNRSSGVHTSLVKSIAEIHQESFKPYASAMRQYLATDKLQKFTDNVELVITAPLQTMAEEVEAIVKEPSFDLTGVNSKLNLPEKIEGFRQGVLPKDHKAFFKTAAYKKIMGLEEGSVYNKNYGSVEQEATLRRIMEVVTKTYALQLAYDSLREPLTQLAFLGYSWKHLGEYTADNNLLLLSDTNELLSRIIGKDETPFIYERMGVKLTNYLIDEFQDTSRMQWHNLDPLVENSISESNDSLVIGDEKQSIYRFRNSDSSILHNLHHDKGTQKSVLRGGGPKENTNYRSSSHIVRFNNTLFATILGLDREEGTMSGFGNVVQDICDKYKHTPGHVEFRPVDNDKLTDEALDDMAAEILRLHDEGGYRWSDIAVLVNTNKEANRVVQHLLDNYFGQISVQSDESLQLVNSKAVQLVISVLRILDRENAKARPEGGNSDYPTQAESRIMINRFEYFISTGHDYQESLELATASRASDSEIIEAIKQRKASSIVALVETVIAHIFSAEERSEQFAYLAALQDRVMEFATSSNTTSVHAFLQWWDSSCSNFTVGSSPDVDAVKVMTIHKSKGLEFHCVLLPSCSWELHWNKNPHVWMPVPEMPSLNMELAPPAIYHEITANDDLEGSPFRAVYKQERVKAYDDCMNKTYVAFTRARTELIAWYFCPKEKEEKGKKGKNDKPKEEPDTIAWLLQKAFAKGVPEGAYLADVMMPLTEHYDAETKRFEYGEPTRCADTKKDEKQPDVQVCYDVYLRDDTDDYTKVDDALELDTDIDDGSEAPETQDDAARREGVIMHAVMARVKQAGSLQAAMSHTWRLMRIAPDQAQAYQQVLEDFMAMPDERVKRWFGEAERVYTEQPIYIPRLNLIRRPDRIVTYADGSAEVVDYKFTDEAAHIGLADHEKQVRDYVGLLTDMGYSPVRGYLAYPRLQQIHEVKTNNDN